MDEANDCKTENAGAGGEVREADGVADNSVGEAREVRAEETRKVRDTGEIFRQSSGSRRNC